MELPIQRTFQFLSSLSIIPSIFETSVHILFKFDANTIHDIYSREETVTAYGIYNLILSSYDPETSKETSEQAKLHFDNIPDPIS